tara:strand:+ start:29350 stop:29652 length:303 start_codon:yes stop_codon:yes gene_type:complete
MSKLSRQQFLSNAIPATIIAAATLTLSFMAYTASSHDMVNRYLAASMLAFAWTYVGYWGYSRFYATKSPHCGKNAALYTLFFTPFFLIKIIRNPGYLKEL